MYERASLGQWASRPLQGIGVAAGTFRGWRRQKRVASGVLRSIVQLANQIPCFRTVTKTISAPESNDSAEPQVGTHSFLTRNTIGDYVMLILTWLNTHSNLAQPKFHGRPSTVLCTTPLVNKPSKTAWRETDLSGIVVQRSRLSGLAMYYNSIGARYVSCFQGVQEQRPVDGRAYDTHHGSAIGADVSRTLQTFKVV